MAFDRKDRFFHKAKAEGFLARSAYKLDELHKKYRLFKAGDFVLDLGAAPGAWSQVAMKIVGPSGRVVGLDLKVVDLKAPNAKFYQMDVFQFDPEILGDAKVKCMLSDMAPNTTGVRNVDQARSLDLCLEVVKLAKDHLAPGGNLVMKLFEGPDAEQVTDQLTDMFQNVRRFKPEAVRKGSFETYFVGLAKRQ